MLPPQEEGPITTVEQLANDLVAMRQRHATEMQALLARIDSSIFDSYDAETLMQPLIVGLIEKQQRTHHLMTLLGVQIPSTNQKGDEIILGLQREWLKRTENHLTEKVNELKDVVKLASKGTPQAEVTSERQGNHYWSMKETGILHAFYPLLGHDYEAYESVLPRVSIDRLKRKINSETQQGNLQKQDPLMVFNPARTTGELLTEARISQKRRQSRQGQSIAQTKRPRQVRVEKSTISEDTSSSESDSDENSQEMDDNSDSK